MQLQNKTKSKLKRKRKMSSDSDSEEIDDPETVMKLDDTDDSDAMENDEPYGQEDNDEPSVQDNMLDEDVSKQEVFPMPQLDDSSVGKFFAVFYSTPTKSYYWGKITKTFEYDENENVSSVEEDFLRRKFISSDPVCIFLPIYSGKKK